jgi:peroxiredoxin
MEAYRDQYATIFHNGRKVTVISISVDPDTTLASWAKDEDFPMVFASDIGGRVGSLYAAYDSTRKQDNRTLYVVAPDGKVAYVTRPFRILAAAAYKELGDVVDRLSPVKKDSAQ